MAKKKNAASLIEAATQEALHDSLIEPAIQEAVFLAESTQSQILSLKKKLAELQVPNSKVPDLTSLSVELSEVTSAIKSEIAYRDSLTQAYTEFATAFGYDPSTPPPPASFAQREGRVIPIYNKHICSCCGITKDTESFHPSFSHTQSHMPICKECATALLFQLYDNDFLLALYRLCAELNVYYDPEIASTVYKKYNNTNHKTPFLDEYISAIPQLPFSDSPILYKESVQSTPPTTETTLEERLRQIYYTPIDTEGMAPPDWGPEDARNYRQVYRIFSYYPFENEPNQKILCKDLLNLLADQNDQADYVKSQSALRIVLAFAKLKELDIKFSEAEASGASSKELKELSDLKSKERATCS